MIPLVWALFDFVKIMDVLILQSLMGIRVFLQLLRRRPIACLIFFSFYSGVVVLCHNINIRFLFLIKL